MPPIRTVVLGALAVGAQAFSSTPTTTTGGLPPCGTIDDNGLNCQGLMKSDGWCWEIGRRDVCDCKTVCCTSYDAVFENGECDTAYSFGR